jgi:hypothetical protein
MNKQNDITSQIAGWTVTEWCARWQISRGQYYALRSKGDAPKVVRVGTRPRITPEHDAEWANRHTESGIFDAK